MKKIVIWAVFLGLKNATVDIFYILGRQKLKYLSKFSKIFSRPEVRLAAFSCVLFVACSFVVVVSIHIYLFISSALFIIFQSFIYSHFDSFVPSFRSYFFDSFILSFILSLHSFLVHSPFLLSFITHIHSLIYFFCQSIIQPFIPLSE